MKWLLVAEMQRALHLLVDKNLESRNWDNYKDVAELKQLLKSIRRHSVIFEKEDLK